MDGDKKPSIYDNSHSQVNMPLKELDAWLETYESKSVGDGNGGETTGHRSGQRIAQTKRTNKDDLSDSKYEHMNKVVN